MIFLSIEKTSHSLIRNNSFLAAYLNGYDEENIIADAIADYFSVSAFTN
ncbi:hypothetical protein SAMN04489723_12111 [Algoriphagus aquimarinus]|uniref:Uncharacterized protein n=1 Tax=Algoriphagus aquimarinus TaxID=237018 RepID=A0A1I1C349_9BACT|nr:hypothetical protein SAMN04489723_12111 [Algoriphagus aquimarinus]